MPSPKADPRDEEVLRRLGVRNEYISQTPNAKQIACLSLHDIEAGLFGGAAGPGKSSCLLMEGLRDPWIRVKGYSCLILRRHRKDLYMPDGLIERLEGRGLDGSPWLKYEIARGRVKWNRDKHGYDFLGEEGDVVARIIMGYADDDRAFEDFLGSAYQTILVDEAVGFSRRQLGMVGSRLRKPPDGPLSKVPLRYRLYSNPGDSRPGESPGHMYLRETYVEGADGVTRFYLPAKMGDNPKGINAESYTRTLALFLDAVTLARYRDGDWSANLGGGWFDVSRFVMLAEQPNLEDVEERVRYWDLAGTDEKIAGDPDYTVGLLMARPIQGRTFLDRELDRIVCHVARLRKDPGQVEAEIKRTAEADGPLVKIRIEEEPGQSGKSQIEHFKRLLTGFDVDGNYVLTPEGNRTKVTGPKDVRSRPFSIRVNNGRVGIVGGDAWVRPYLDEMAGLWGNVVHDDQGDASSGADLQLSQAFRPAMLEWAIQEDLAIKARKQREQEARKR